MAPRAGAITGRPNVERELPTATLRFLNTKQDKQLPVEENLNLSRLEESQHPLGTNGPPPSPKDVMEQNAPTPETARMEEPANSGSAKERSTSKVGSALFKVGDPY